MLLLLFFQSRVGGIFSDTFQSDQRGGFGTVTVGNGDDLAVPGTEPKSELTAFVPIQLKFRIGYTDFFRNGQIRKIGVRRGFSYTFDAPQYGCPGGIDFRGHNILPVSGIKIEFDAGIYFF